MQLNAGSATHCGREKTGRRGQGFVRSQGAEVAGLVTHHQLPKAPTRTDSSGPHPPMQTASVASIPQGFLRFPCRLTSVCLHIYSSCILLCLLIPLGYVFELLQRACPPLPSHSLIRPARHSWIPARRSRIPARAPAWRPRAGCRPSASCFSSLRTPGTQDSQERL